MAAMYRTQHDELRAQRPIRRLFHLLGILLGRHGHHPGPHALAVDLGSTNEEEGEVGSCHRHELGGVCRYYGHHEDHLPAVHGQR